MTTWHELFHEVAGLGRHPSVVPDISQAPADNPPAELT